MANIFLPCILFTNITSSKFLEPSWRHAIHHMFPGWHISFKLLWLRIPSWMTQTHTHDNVSYAIEMFLASCIVRTQEILDHGSHSPCFPNLPFRFTKTKFLISDAACRKVKTIPFLVYDRGWFWHVLSRGGIPLAPAASPHQHHPIQLLEYQTDVRRCRFV